MTLALSNGLRYKGKKDLNALDWSSWVPSTRKINLKTFVLKPHVIIYRLN